jgi:hypothetical protein
MKKSRSLLYAVALSQVQTGELRVFRPREGKTGRFFPLFDAWRPHVAEKQPAPGLRDRANRNDRPRQVELRGPPFPKHHYPAHQHHPPQRNATLSVGSLLKSPYLLYFSQPAADRTLFKAMK